MEAFYNLELQEVISTNRDGDYKLDANLADSLEGESLIFPLYDGKQILPQLLHYYKILFFANSFRYKFRKS